MNAIDIEVGEIINGVRVSLRVSWSPEALCNALGASEDGYEDEIFERLSSDLSTAMRLALPQARAEADRNLLKALNEILSGKLKEAAA